LNPQICS